MKKKKKKETDYEKAKADTFSYKNKNKKNSLLMWFVSGINWYNNSLPDALFSHN